MKRALWLLSLLVMVHGASAEPLTRYLWLDVESMAEQVIDASGISHQQQSFGTVFNVEPGARGHFAIAPSDWLRLRVYTTENQQLAPPSVWLSGGDGVYVSREPLKQRPGADYIDYFYALSGLNAQRVIVANTQSATHQFSLYYSDRVVMPDYAGEAQIMIDNSMPTTQLQTHPGYTTHDVQYISANTQYTLQFAQPGVYHVELRIPWQASFRLSQLHALTVTAGQTETQHNLLAQLDTDATYTIPNASQPQWLSRPIRVPIYVSQADQQVTVSLDSPMYARGLRSDSQQQFLFNHNAPGNIAQQRQQQLALASPTIVDRVFYRALAPNEVMPTQQAVVLEEEINTQPQVPLPYNPAMKTSADYFYSLAADATLTVPLPQQSQSPPLRLSILHGDQPAALTVQTDSGERIELRYWPTLAVTEHWQLTPASRIAAATAEQDLAQPGSHIALHFTRPYQQLRVVNTGEHTANVALFYRNQQRRTPTDAIWLSEVTRDSAPQLLQLLQQGASAQYLTQPVNYELAYQWRPRLRARAEQFAERYRGAIASAQSLDDASFKQLSERLSQQFQQPFTHIDAIYRFINELGYPVTARRLVVSFALARSGEIQQQAEQLLQQIFRQQQRWFDTEGYWAWRFFNDNQTAALRPIATSWTYQNRITEAVRLGWLIRQLPEQTAHSQTSFTPTAEQLHAIWQKLSPNFTGNTRHTLIYNSALDQYLSSFFLAASEPLSATIEPSQQLRLTIYPQANGHRELTTQLRELTVSAGGQEYRFAVRFDRISQSLQWSQQPQRLLLSPQTYILTFDRPVSQLRLHSKGFNTAFTLERPDYPSAELLQQHQQQAQLTQQLSRLALDTQQQQLSPAQVAAAYQPLLEQSLTDEQQFLLNQITTNYGWQRLDTVAASDGIAYLDSEHWQARSDGSKLRSALMLTPLRDGERRLRYGLPTEVVVNLQQPQTLQLSLRLPDEIARAQEPTTVHIDTGQNQHQLTVSHQPRTLSIPLDAGRHTIRLLVTEPAEGVLLYQLQQSSQQRLLPEPTIKAYRAQRDTPVQLFAPADNLLKIERYQQAGQVPHNSYRWLSEDQLLTFPHQGQSRYSYYRFFIWQPQPKSAEELDADALELEPAATFTTPADRWPQPQRSVFTHTVFDIDEQDEGTWGFDLGYRLRSNFDEDTLTPQEKFIDVGWNYQRRLSDGAAYWDNSVRWREHNGNGLGTLVSENRMNWIIDNAIDIEAELDGYYQAKAADARAQNAWSLRATVSGRWRYSWNYRTRNDVDVSLFAWALSEDSVPLTAIDDDIVTQYKLDHRQGISISDTLIYQPWLDSRAHIGGELTFNEFNQGVSIDKWSLNAGWRQYYAPWRLSLDARYRRYLADDDRRNDSSATLVGASIDYDLWQQNGNLWQLSVDFRHNFDRDTSSAFIGISWNHTDGQGYDDLAPRRRAFSSLRRQHALGIIDANDITERADDH